MSELRPEHAIFDGIADAAAIDRFEQPGGGNGILPFEGSIDPNCQATFVDPKSLVTCYVRPGRQFHMVADPGALHLARAQGYKVDTSDPIQPRAYFIPDKPYKVSRQTFDGNRAVLCSPMEYRVLKAQQGSLRQQNVTKQIQDMRKHQVERSRALQTPEQLAREESQRKKYIQEEKATDVAEALQREVVAEKKQAEATEADRVRDAILGSLTPEALEQYCADTLNQADAISATFGERGRQQVLQAATEEVEMFRVRWGQLHPAARETAGSADGLETKVTKLRGLLDKGIITQADFDRQLAGLVS